MSRETVATTEEAKRRLLELGDRRSPLALAARWLAAAAVATALSRKRGAWARLLARLLDPR